MALLVQNFKVVLAAKQTFDAAELVSLLLARIGTEDGLQLAETKSTVFLFAEAKTNIRGKY